MDQRQHASTTCINKVACASPDSSRLLCTFGAETHQVLHEQFQEKRGLEMDNRFKNTTYLCLTSPYEILYGFRQWTAFEKANMTLVVGSPCTVKTTQLFQHPRLFYFHTTHTQTGPCVLSLPHSIMWHQVMLIDAPGLHWQPTQYFNLV